MYDKKRIFRDLIDLEYIDGLHSGRWEDELKMDSCAEEYLATVIMFAIEYDIEYDKDVSNYVEDEEYEAKCYATERMASDIKEKVERKLIEILLNE